MYFRSFLRCSMAISVRSRLFFIVLCTMEPVGWPCCSASRLLLWICGFRLWSPLLGFGFRDLFVRLGLYGLCRMGGKLLIDLSRVDWNLVTSTYLPMVLFSYLHYGTITSIGHTSLLILLKQHISTLLQHTPIKSCIITSNNRTQGYAYKL